MRLYLFLILCMVVSLSYAQSEDPNCPGAPVPMLIVGERGRVAPGDANNVRDASSRDGALIGAIPGDAVFDVLEGPVCTDGLNWWRVDYDGLIGWTVEGQGTDYWVLPVAPELPTPTLAPAVMFEAPRPAVNALNADTIPGSEARVISDDFQTDQITLLVRSEPSINAEVVGSLNAGDIVIIESSPTEADGLFWWEVGTEQGLEGWVIGGLVNDSGEFERTLLPQCPETEDRVAFFISRYLYTANPDGSGACILDKMRLPAVHTFYPYFAYFPNELIWSPDHTQLMYIDFASDSLQELFLVSADGLQRRQVTDNSDVYWADWSPDGQRILLSQTINGRGTPQIWTMKIDGTAYGALTSGDHRKVWGGWLADSDRLIFVENIGESRNQIGPTEQEYIFSTVSVSSGGFKELYRTNEDVTNLRLSPDRSQVFIASWEMTPIEGSEYFDYTGLNSRLLDTATGEITELPHSHYDVTWFSDSSGVLELEGTDQIIISRLDAAEPTTLTASQPWNEFTWVQGWLPDGRLVVLTSDFSVYSTDSYQLMAIDLTDGTVTILVDAES